MDDGLGWSLASPLKWRRAGESADVQVVWVGSRSVIHAQDVGASPTLSKRTLPTFASESHGLEKAHRRLHM